MVDGEKTFPFHGLVIKQRREPARDFARVRAMVPRKRSERADTHASPVSALAKVHFKKPDGHIVEIIVRDAAIPGPGQAVSAFPMWCCFPSIRAARFAKRHDFPGPEGREQPTALDRQIRDFARHGSA